MNTGSLTTHAVLGSLLGARSGDKGGAANVGVWIPVAVPARQEAYDWIDQWLTVRRLHDLLPETRNLVTHRYALPNIFALNFVIEGFLGRGVSENALIDPQAKGLGEHLRARVAPIPTWLLPAADVNLA